MAPSKLVFKYVKATGLGSFQKDALKTSSKSRVSIHGELNTKLWVIGMPKSKS